MLKDAHKLILSRLLRLSMVLVIVLGVAVLIRNREVIHPDAVRAWVEGFGVMAPLLFMLLFAVSAILFVPATVMVLAGGVLFGPWLGAFYNVSGATLGAVAAFLISRYLARDWAERRAGKRLKLIMLGVKEEGWKFVLTLRLVGVPYFVLNYLLGLTPIGLGHYTVASFLGLLPTMSAITYAGHVGFEAINSTDGLTGKLILAVALVGLAALVPIVVRILRKRKTGEISTDLS